MGKNSHSGLSGSRRNQERGSFRKRTVRGLGGGILHSSLLEMPSGQTMRYVRREVDRATHEVTVFGYEPVEGISLSEEAHVRTLPTDFLINGEHFSVRYRIVEKPEHDYAAAQLRLEQNYPARSSSESPSNFS